MVQSVAISLEKALDSGHAGAHCGGDREAGCPDGRSTNLDHGRGVPAPRRDAGPDAGIVPATRPRR
eukprot:7747818-Pyramimonas_sp.AAC.1